MSNSFKCKAFEVLALIAKAPRSHTELMQLTGQNDVIITDTLRKAQEAGLIFQYGKRAGLTGIAGRPQLLYRMSLETQDPPEPVRPPEVEIDDDADDFPIVQSRRQAGEWERRAPSGGFLAVATPFDGLMVMA